jgi:hypothetical protein
VATTAGLKDALVYYADLKGDAGVDEISAEFDALFALTLSENGGGKQLINSSVNGKNFGWSERTATVEERLAVFAEALREINGDKIVATYPNFACLQR